MKRGAVFFDRDGVLNVDVGYLSEIERFQWIDGAKDAIRSAKEAGLLSIVVTNQSGVARGYYGEADVEALHDWMNLQLREESLAIDAFYYCPFHDDAVVERYRLQDHPDRKPNPGMIVRAMADWNVDPRRAVLVGDKQSDIEAGQRAGIATIWFRGGKLVDAIAPAIEAIAKLDAAR